MGEEKVNNNSDGWGERSKRRRSRTTKGQQTDSVADSGGTGHKEREVREALARELESQEV